MVCAAIVMGDRVFVDVLIVVVINFTVAGIAVVVVVLLVVAAKIEVIEVL